MAVWVLAILTAVLLFGKELFCDVKYLVTKDAEEVYEDGDV